MSSVAAAFPFAPMAAIGASMVPGVAGDLENRGKDGGKAADGKAGRGRRAPLSNITNTATQAVPAAGVKQAAQAVARVAEAEPEPMHVEVPAPRFIALPKTFADIDLADADDPQACVEYVQEVHAALKEAETRNRVRTDYMSNQGDITPTMRAILVDWLVEVSEEYKLSLETLYLTVCYIDRFLASQPVYRGKLQLVGVTAMLIASKFEEIYTPTVEDFVYITDNTYERDELLKMEALMLQVLDFELVTTTAVPFLSRYCKIADLDARTAALAHYYAEWTLQDYLFISFVPSHVAACAVALALATTGKRPWSNTLEQYTQLTPMDLRECIGEMCRVIGDIPKSTLVAVVEKYSRSKYSRVSQGVMWTPSDPVPFH